MSTRLTPELVTGGRVLREPRLSPDGRLVAYLSLGATVQVVVQAAAGGEEMLVVADPPPARRGGVISWLPDSQSLVYATADGQLWWRAIYDALSRPLAVDTPAAMPAVSPDGDWLAYVADERRVTLTTFDGRHVRHVGHADFVLDPVWSPSGDRVAWHAWSDPAMPWDRSSIVTAPADGGAPVAVDVGAADCGVSEPRFSPAAELSFLCDAGGTRNLWVADPDGAAARVLVEDVHEHGPAPWGGGNRSFAWAPDGGALVLTRLEEGMGRALCKDLESGWFRPFLTDVCTSISWAGRHVAMLRSGPTTPDVIEVVDGSELRRRVVAAGDASLDPEEVARSAARSGRIRDEEVAELAARLQSSLRSSGAHAVRPDLERRVIARGPRPELDEAALAEPEIVRWAGDDGVQVVGRLYRPTDESLGDPPPLLVWTHGGPTDQAEACFRADVAFFCDRGYAVLFADHRGSTGHGRAWQTAMNGQWGVLDVADTAAGMIAAADRGWGDGQRMVPIGESAGGFTSLLLLALHGEWCAAAVSVSGVTDLAALRAVDHRYEAHYNDALIGPLPGAAEVERSRSPISHAAAIRAPLLLLHGTADPVVPVEGSRSLAALVRTAGGGPIELVEYEGEGHTISDPANRCDALRRIDDFLTTHVLGGSR